MPPLASGEDCLYICFGIQRNDQVLGALHSVLVELMNTGKVFIFRLVRGFSLYLGPSNLPKCLPHVPFLLFESMVKNMNDYQYSCVFCRNLVPSKEMVQDGFIPGDYMTSPRTHQAMTHRVSGDQDLHRVDLVLHTSIGALVYNLRGGSGRSCTATLWPRYVRN